MTDFSYSIYDSLDWDSSNSIELSESGWKVLTVQWLMQEPYLIWKVKGTTKIFTILYSVVLSKHSKIEQHFQIVLKSLREDILMWNESNFSASWQEIYKKEFIPLLA